MIDAGRTDSKPTSSNRTEPGHPFPASESVPPEPGFPLPSGATPRGPLRSTLKIGTIQMKVQLIVVQGKPEGKVIPLAGPSFKIGRGDTCHLRPNSEQVSREHAEFQVTADTVTVRDLGSRNGTLVNNKQLTGVATLKDRDLVQVGPL